MLQRNGRFIAATCAALMLTACASIKIPTPVGGSRSDGVIYLAYDVGIFEAPQIDYAAAQSTAIRGCNGWGYTSAQPFGGGQQQCIYQDAYGSCVRYRVTITYQCTGAGNP